MIEAYEIGIRLALDDGISAGVQAIRRELLDLDRVIEASSVKLASLRDAAGVVSVPSAAEQPSGKQVQPAEPEEGTQAPALAGGPSEESLVDEPPELRRAPRVGPPAVEGAKLDDAPARASAPSPSVERRDAPSEPSASSAPYWTAAPPAPNVPAPPSNASGPEQAFASADAAPIVRLAVAPAAAVFDEGQAAAPKIDAAPPLRRNLPPTQRPSPNDDARPRPNAAGRPSAPTPKPTPPPLSGAAPTARASGAVRETVAPEPAAPDRELAAAKTGEDADQRTMEVFIYLEGAPLGRWMADQLDRAASRPSASVTGFDPRVGPAWPGAPIG